ncbi:MAG: hypothetical protein R2939_13235 [Kofleriaceae bacterium]
MSAACRDQAPPIPRDRDAAPVVMVAPSEVRARLAPSATGRPAASQIFEEREPNDEPAQAQPLALGAAVRGTSTAPPTSTSSRSRCPPQARSRCRSTPCPIST